MAINTGKNSGDKAKKSVPTYHGAPGKLGIPQKQKSAPHPSNQTGSGNTSSPKKG